MNAPFLTDEQFEALATWVRRESQMQTMLVGKHASRVSQLFEEKRLLAERAARALLTGRRLIGEARETGNVDVLGDLANPDQGCRVVTDTMNLPGDRYQSGRAAGDLAEGQGSGSRESPAGAAPARPEERGYLKVSPDAVQRAYDAYDRALVNLYVARVDLERVLRRRRP